MKSYVEIGSLYTFGKLIGKGGFSRVYSCTHTMTHTECAVKVIKKETLAGKKHLIQLMEQEIEVLKATDHPNIVRLIDMIEDEAHVYIVTELMRGGDLSKYMAKKKKIPERQAASIIKQCLQAINYMHK